MRRFVFALVLTGIAASSAQAQQPMNRVRVGVLECRGGASIGFLVGSVTNLGCVLRVEGMPEDRYIATIRKVGLDLGITEAQDGDLSAVVDDVVCRLGHQIQSLLMYQTRNDAE